MSRNMSLQMASEDQMDLTMMNMPMRISDAASMVRTIIPKNDPPYDAEVKKLNNKRADEWHSTVLMKVADGNGTIPAGRVHGCLMYFLEGKEAASYQKYKDKMVIYQPELVTFWIDLLKRSSISELYDIGSGVVANGWSIIKGAVRNHFADEKWNVVYSKSEDPYVWDKLANDNPHIMNGRPLPFGLRLEDLKDMETKIQSVLRNPIQPH